MIDFSRVKEICDYLAEKGILKKTGKELYKLSSKFVDNLRISLNSLEEKCFKDKLVKAICITILKMLNATNKENAILVSEFDEIYLVVASMVEIILQRKGIQITLTDYKIRDNEEKIYLDSKFL